MRRSERHRIGEAMSMANTILRSVSRLPGGGGPSGVKLANKLQRFIRRHSECLQAQPIKSKHCAVVLGRHLSQGDRQKKLRCAREDR